GLVPVEPTGLSNPAISQELPIRWPGILLLRARSCVRAPILVGPLAALLLPARAAVGLACIAPTPCPAIAPLRAAVPGLSSVALLTSVTLPPIGTAVLPSGIRSSVGPAVTRLRLGRWNLPEQHFQVVAVPR